MPPCAPRQAQVLTAAGVDLVAAASARGSWCVRACVCVRVRACACVRACIVLVEPRARLCVWATTKRAHSWGPHQMVWRPGQFPPAWAPLALIHLRNAATG